MINTIDIRDLTATAHGYPPAPYPLVGVPVRDANKIGTAVGRTHLGIPYFMDVTIDGKRLPNEPLLTFSGQKRIIQTAIAGSKRRGTVKELIAANDYKIKIEGVCIDPTQRSYPTAQVQTIIDLCETPAALDFENELATLFRIHRIVITGYGFANMQGTPHAQKYVINAVSDEDFYGNLKHAL